MLIGFFLNPSETQLYADDTLLFFNGSSIREIESYLSADLRNIISWLHSNYLFLNYSKTKVILVGKHQRLSRVAIFSVSAFDKTFKIGSTSSSISVSCSIQASLGVITSTIFCSKISARLGMLRKACKVIPREACITHYDSTTTTLHYTTTKAV